MSAHVHVLPKRDLVGHVPPLADVIEPDAAGWLATESEDDGSACPCGPSVCPEKLADGSVGWLVVHHSLDGREAREVAP